MISPVINGGSFIGCTLVLNQGGVTTTINNSAGYYGNAGLRIVNNTYHHGITAEEYGFVAFDSAGVVRAQMLHQAGGGGEYGKISLNSNGTQKPFVEINGQQVLTSRYPGSVTTLADVIAVLNWHGLH